MLGGVALLWNGDVAPWTRFHNRALALLKK